MKKTLLVLLTLAICILSFTACAANDAKINIGYLAGPTGMGMAKLIKDTPEDDSSYTFTAYSDPNTATSDLISGSIDMACLPTNAAANLFNKGKDISVIAINTLGSLYVIADKTVSINSISDLSEKTVYASVPGSTTEPIMKYILEQNNISATVLVDSATHDQLVDKVKASNGSVIALLPEPKVSATLLQAKNYEIKLNLSEEWNKISDQPLAMGCIVVRNEFLKENKRAVNNFLNDYKNSVDFISNPDNLSNAAQTIVDVSIIPKLPLATSSLKNLEGSIVLITGKDMKNTLTKFYDVLLTSSAQSVGGKQPNEEFYYQFDKGLYYE